MPPLWTAPLVYLGAAAAEIAGSFAVWAWWRNGQSALWLIPGGLLLFAFAYLLTLIPAAQAGRAYASYGGVYIAASLAWLWLVESRVPDRWDLIGAGLALLGAAVIILGPRA